MTPHPESGAPQGQDGTGLAGLRYGTVAVATHEPHWFAAAQSHMEEVATALQDIASGIEHVGSTSVPGLQAKPIVDLAVLLAPGAEPETVIDRLVSAGYLFRGDKADHGGLLFVFEPEPHMRTVHVHVLGDGDPQWARYLAVRDRLRRDPALAARYGELKTGLAQRFPDDRASYTAAKEAFFAELLHDLPLPDTARPVVQRVRALLLTPAGRLLVIRRIKTGQPVYWVLPGGGIEPGDGSLETAAHREISEETGGAAELHRLVHIVTVAGGSHAIFLGRIQQWDPNKRTGPELLKTGNGHYDLDELDLDHPALTDGRPWPVPTAVWFAGLVRAGRDPFGLPDLRDSRPVQWQPRHIEYHRDDLPEPEAPTHQGVHADV